MYGQRATMAAVVVLLGGLAGFPLAFSPAEETTATPADVIRVGLVESFFRDVPPGLAAAATGPFQALMESQTGLRGQLVTVKDAGELGHQLSKDKVRLGVFHGLEFAWARLQYPDLRPLVIAVCETHHLRAHLVVRQDTDASDFSDLKGKSLAVPKGSREHCHLFLDHRCKKHSPEPRQWFAKITTPANCGVALDDVISGKVAAAVVDEVALKCFQGRKPKQAAKLKTVQRSEIFPAAVVVYHPSKSDPDLLKRFRDGMIAANQTERGQSLLMWWKLTGFERVPEDYEQTLTEIVKTYPPPALAASK